MICGERPAPVHFSTISSLSHGFLSVLYISPNYTHSQAVVSFLLSNSCSVGLRRLRLQLHLALVDRGNRVGDRHTPYTVTQFPYIGTGQRRRLLV